jgi:hypothetical protein
VFQPALIARACLRVAEQPVRARWIGGNTVMAILAASPPRRGPAARLDRVGRPDVVTGAAAGWRAAR